MTKTFSSCTSVSPRFHLNPLSASHADTKIKGHCVDIIRQVLMCNVDTGVLGQVWANKDKPAAFPDFNTRHKVRCPLDTFRNLQPSWGPRSSPRATLQMLTYGCISARTSTRCDYGPKSYRHRLQTPYRRIISRIRTLVIHYQKRHEDKLYT